MDIKIVSREKNPLLHREKISFEINSSKTTPSRKEIREKLSALTNAKPELVVIKGMEQEFGFQHISGVANIYENKDAFDKVELSYLARRDIGTKKREKKAKEEAPAEAAKPAKGKPGEKKKVGE